jgi:hypothetical protein
MDTDLTSAKQCINCLNALLRRFYPLNKVEWLEQALVTRVYITCKYPQTQTVEGIKDLKRILDGLSPLHLPANFFRSPKKSRSPHFK